MKITITCIICGAQVEREYCGGKKRIYCDDCGKQKARERAGERGIKKGGKHRKLAKPNTPYRQYHPEEEDRIPVIPPAERARIAQEAIKERLGLDDMAFARWMRGKVWNCDTGFRGKI